MIWHEPEPGALTAAIAIGRNATLGDRIAVDQAMEDCDPQHWGSAVWALLQLYDHMSRSLRTQRALLYVHSRLMTIACDDDRLSWRMGAAIIAAYAAAVDATNAGDSELRWLAMANLNSAVAEANEGECFELTLAAALAVWRSLLPEVTPDLIQSTAAELWSESL